MTLTTTLPPPVPKELFFELQNCQDIPDYTRERMYQLLTEHFDHVKLSRFESDLGNKHYVGLLRDHAGTIQGFSTLAINPADSGTEDYNILFSGDTIITRKYWGTQELMRGFGRTLGQLLTHLDEKPLYWFLTSMGHRTYMYLPLFFKLYYPANDSSKEADLAQIVDKVAYKMYPDHWNAKKGILEFDSSFGCLKSELAQASWDKQNNPNISFFLERNPEFHKGHELACLAEVSLNNLHSRGLRHVLSGMKQALPGDVIAQSIQQAIRQAA